MGKNYIPNEEKNSSMINDDTELVYGSVDMIRQQAFDLLNNIQDRSVLTELVTCLRDKFYDLTSDKEETHKITWEEYKEYFSPEKRMERLQEFERQYAAGHVEGIDGDEFIAQFNKKHSWHSN